MAEVAQALFASGVEPADGTGWRLNQAASRPGSFVSWPARQRSHTESSRRQKTIQSRYAPHPGHVRTSPSTTSGCSQRIITPATSWRDGTRNVGGRRSGTATSSAAGAVGVGSRQPGHGWAVCSRRSSS